jgi:hypothetical protein
MSSKHSRNCSFCSKLSLGLSFLPCLRSHRAMLVARELLMTAKSFLVWDGMRSMVADASSSASPKLPPAPELVEVVAAVTVGGRLDIVAVAAGQGR